MTVICWQCLGDVDRDTATWLGGVPYCDECAWRETGEDARTLDTVGDR